MSLTEQGITIYMPDTNCFRYKTTKIQQIVEGTEENEQQKLARTYKQATDRFWEKIIEESESEDAIVMVSSEVVQELKVQSHTLPKKEVKLIYKLLDILDVENSIVPQKLEYELRDFSNYARKQFNEMLVPTGRKMDYLRVSDARIFVHAYLNDAVIATANIKDFILYPLFYGSEENKLYDVLNGEYVNVLESGRNKVLEDENFISLLATMKEIKFGTIEDA